MTEGSSFLFFLVVIVECVYGGIMMSPTRPGANNIDGALIESLIAEPTPEQLRLNELCRSQCTVEKCFLKHDQDCSVYIMCELGAKKFDYRARIQPCAFGTYWAGVALQKKITCDLPQNVVCNNDPCTGRPVGYRQPYQWNCKGYWECGTKGPEPKCCPEGMHFNATFGDCVYSIPGQCMETCPIKTESCMSHGVQTAYYADGNCKTYWDCQDRRPHPVCCPEGQGYNDTLKACVINGCADQCPVEYRKDVCNKQNVYPLSDYSCRTYMKCNAVLGDERWCCQSGYYFDSVELICKEKPYNMDTCTDTCPEGFSVECPLQPVANDSSKYIVISHGIATQMFCAPGTAFRQDICTCGVILQGVPDNSCNMELDIIFNYPNWMRAGSQKYTQITEYGQKNPGKNLNNRASYLFDGSLYYRANFFHQAMPELYIYIVYIPGNPTVEKQVLVSNCMMMDGTSPSLDLALIDGMIVLSLYSPTSQDPANPNMPIVLRIPYTPNDWNEFTAYYDGQVVDAFNKGGSTTNVANPPRAMTGEIEVAAEGLDIGGCMGQVSMFKGSLAELRISKCLRREWVDQFQLDTEAFRPPA